MPKEIKALSLLDILPDSILSDAKVNAAAQALDTELQSVTADTIQVLHIPRLDVLPEKIIDLLAWQWHTDYYDGLADLATKRKLVKQSLDWHRHKGTLYAVNNMLSAISTGYHAEEWFNYNGEPYYFRIVEQNGDLISYDEKEIIKAVNSVKNVRSWLEGVLVKVDSVLNSEVTGYISGHHTADIALELEATQGYWVDQGYIDLYWNGYHIQGGSGEQYKRTSRKNDTIKYNASINKHIHYFDGSLENSGREWMDARGNIQKHEAEIIEFIEATQNSSNYMGYKRNRSFRMNGSIKHNSPKMKMYQHTATLTITKGEVTTEEAV